jgi:VWFA-related protein
VSPGFGPLRVEIRNVDARRYPETVELRAFVYDTAGRFVMGLAPPYLDATRDFRSYWRALYDSCAGASVPIDSFDVVEVREDRREPVAIAYVLDHSGSMGELRTRRLREAAHNTLRLIRRTDRVAILTFTTTVTRELPLSGGTTEFRRRFEPLDLSTYGGGTSLYDAALEAIEEVSKAPQGNRRSIIVFSDGADGNSDSTAEAVHRSALRSGVTIYTIAYGMAEEDVLKNLASYTGGRMYRIYSSREFPYVFADIYRRMNNYYRITYRAPECAALHTARSILDVPELMTAPMEASGVYDQSMFTPFTDVGDLVFVNIEFESDQAAIRNESAPVVEDVARLMRQYPDMRLEVRGHTDDRGTPEYNLDLSHRRARAVADALIDRGIARSRLRVTGFGESRPVASNDSEEGRRRNRRTEFLVTHR